MINQLLESNIDCPYCGETIGILVDQSIDGQSYIEDCQVCCRPINISVWQDDCSEIRVSVTHENE